MALAAALADAGAARSADVASPSASGAAPPSAPLDPLADWQPVAYPEAEPVANLPDWAVDAVFYQIFPERFRNGDAGNDPVRESLEFPDAVPRNWSLSSWTGDWYARADWERAKGTNFYEHGVFDRRYGGDLQGVLDKLDYLQELGVTAIYFNPVFYGRSLHKYDGASMHHIDPYFGPDPQGDLALIAQESADPATWRWTAADKLFLRLVAELHRRGMRVIVDGVFNHTGRDFFAFADLRRRQRESPYQDWYLVEAFDDPQTTENEFRYKGWWGVDTLPEFANNAAGDNLQAGPRDYVMAVTRRWMDPDGDGSPADGIDGWRLDVANEVPPAFWQEWHALVRRLNPQAYTVAEVWDHAREFLLTCGFSATMNYHAFAYPIKGFVIDGRLPASAFGRELLLRTAEYPAAMRFGLQNLVDGHDTDRLASMIVNRPAIPYRQAERFDYDVSERSSPRWYGEYQVRKPDAEERKIQRLAAALQMTSVGAPMIYYGTEAGMWGGDDPCDRMPMVWDDLQYEDQRGDPLGRPRPPDAVAFDRELFAFYRDAIGLRRSQPALRRGGIALAGSDDAAQWFVFRRVLGDDQLWIGVNRGNKPYAWQPPAGKGGLLFATSDAPLQVGPQGPPRLVVPPLTAIVWQQRK